MACCSGPLLGVSVSPGDAMRLRLERRLDKNARTHPIARPTSAHYSLRVGASRTKMDDETRPFKQSWFEGAKSVPPGANVRLRVHCRLRVTESAIAVEGCQIGIEGTHFAAMLAIASATPERA